MKSDVSVAEAINEDGVLPERVHEALGELVGAATEGLLVLSVEVGLGVLRELLEEEVGPIVGPKGRWNPDRIAVRHGHELMRNALTLSQTSACGLLAESVLSLA